ncbi:ubiquitin carboxyl-terminal hydrolase isozyme L3 [Amyelois transitella]|uniref:ubiquitin carboxyl-terminal hydrolase isozyme L3 n=1 Tax=Amyelois transitella TaxID=680683 RepID=UPI00067AC4EE|nr:ubiquitin carboxyl-terminal hydrolase isozyme L3 [Amyelois transitella]
MATETLVPLESNPDVMNKFLQKLGVPGNWAIVDVMGLDPEMLSWVPRPVISVMLLFPISDNYENHKKKEENDILSTGQEVTSNIFYMKQNLSNACGTIALVHSVANNCDKIQLTDGAMKKFLEEAKGLDAVARGALLEKTEAIINAHKELAQEGQTNTPSAEDPVNHHFITFVHKDGALYELDGRKAFPINHGPTTPDSLLEDAAKVCKEFMARDPNEVRFTVVALAASD